MSLQLGEQPALAFRILLSALTAPLEFVLKHCILVFLLFLRELNEIFSGHCIPVFLFLSSCTCAASCEFSWRQAAALLLGAR
jgi:hypothetical protein